MFARAFIDDKIWIDVLLFVFFSTMHILAWPNPGSSAGTRASGTTTDVPQTPPANTQPSATKVPQTPPANAQTSVTVTTVSGAVTGGIQAVGILVPATLVAVTLAHPKVQTLSQFLYADIWFTLSLFFGLSILWTTAVNPNVRRRFVGYQYGMQLFSLGVGSIRLLIGIAILFSGGAS